MDLRLDVNEIAILAKIIEAAQSKGLFAASDMVTIGTVYQKLLGTLQAVSEAQQQQASEESQKALGELDVDDLSFDEEEEKTAPRRRKKAAAA